MASDEEGIRIRLLSEFGCFNFLREGNFLPVVFVRNACERLAAEEGFSSPEFLEALVEDGLLEQVDVPESGFRLTEKGYALVVKPRPRSWLENIFTRLKS